MPSVHPANSAAETEAEPCLAVVTADPLVHGVAHLLELDHAWIVLAEALESAIRLKPYPPARQD